MPVTPPTTVIASHLRWPIRLFSRVIFRLIVEDGDFVSANSPTFFGQTGQPVTLTAELAAGSRIRVEHDGRGTMLAVQLLNPLFENPFALLR